MGQEQFSSLEDQGGRNENHAHEHDCISKSVNQSTVKSDVVQEEYSRPISTVERRSNRC